MYEIYIDGSSRGNPGPSGIGVIAFKENKRIFSYREFIGIKTNNQAEYESLRRALEMCSKLDKELTIFSDSELLVNQRNSKYKLRNQELKVISRDISILEKNFEKILYKHVPREKNGKADKLANRALNEHIKKNMELAK